MRRRRVRRPRSCRVEERRGRVGVRSSRAQLSFVVVPCNVVLLCAGPESLAGPAALSLSVSGGRAGRRGRRARRPSPSSRLGSAAERRELDSRAGASWSALTGLRVLSGARERAELSSVAEQSEEETLTAASLFALLSGSVRSWVSSERRNRSAAPQRAAVSAASERVVVRGQLVLAPSHLHDRPARSRLE